MKITQDFVNDWLNFVFSPKEKPYPGYIQTELMTRFFPYAEKNYTPDAFKAALEEGFKKYDLRQQAKTYEWADVTAKLDAIFSPEPALSWQQKTRKRCSEWGCNIL